jgi:hypothetical protein
MTTSAQRRKLLSNLTVTELAYIAGFIDGEGSFTMEPRKHPSNGLRCRIPEVVASSVDKEIIDCCTLSAAAPQRQSDTAGDQHKRPDCWTLRGESAVALTRLLLPELRIERRRRRAEKLGSFRELGWARTQAESERYEAFAQELFTL